MQELGIKKKYEDSGFILNEGFMPEIGCVDLVFNDGQFCEDTPPSRWAWITGRADSLIYSWRPSAARGWKRWRGGDIEPCPPELKVDIVLRSGDVDLLGCEAWDWNWVHYAGDDDIIWWRVHNPEDKIVGYDLEEYEEEEEGTVLRFRDEIPDLMGKVFVGPETTVDFHGEFSNMSEEIQDAIINPKHYKIIPAGNYPNGLEYMDICDHALSHLSGVEAHLVGQILKYALRVGKKDAMEQDARKIEWYATRLVNTVKGKN